MQLGKNVIALFRIFLTGKSISDTIFMIQEHLEGQNVNFKVKMQKYNLKTNR